MELYIGLISGTSIDGIDAVLVDFSVQPLKTLATLTFPIPAALKQELHHLCTPLTQTTSLDFIDELGQLDVQLGELFAEAALSLLQQTAYSSQDIKAIGSHGQTIRHRPQLRYPFSLQIGDPNIIAEKTAITTVADFRRRDMAAGGQGAPLVPAFHEAVFHCAHQDRVILNIGGMANLTILPKDRSHAVLGFDTGPGNTLLDAWTRKHLQQPHDNKGQWAAGGKIIAPLLKSFLAEVFFKQAPPKSTGRELFNLEWVEQHLAVAGAFTPQDIQTTLTELTAITIKDAIQQYGFYTGELLVCGGGIHNDYLMQRLKALLPNYAAKSTQALDLHPDHVEASAFAWMAKQSLQQQASNLPTATGARHTVILGGIYYKTLNQ